MAMEIKCITWVGNMLQKFEDIYLDMEDAAFEETVKYLGNQMQTVGESVKQICSDVMQDLLPSPSCDLDETSASELLIDQNTDAGQTTKDSRINDEVNDVIHAESCDSNAFFSSASCNSVKEYNKSNLGGDKQNTNIPASKTVSEITLSVTDSCLVNQNHADTVSKPTFSESITVASVADCCNEIESITVASVAYCCNEIENASTKEIPDVLGLIESAEAEENSYSYNVLFVDPYEIIETCLLDVPKTGTIVEQGDKTMQQDDELKLEQTCVMVIRDGLQSVPNAGVNLRTSKNKKRQPFLLSKKAARRQEYEELAILHGNNNEKGDCAESFCPILQDDDHKKLLLPDISESEWELL